MDKSTHKVEVVRIALKPHPNADQLSVVDVFDGYPCCVRTQDWKDGDLAAYVPPDSVVDVSRPEFAFLDKGKPKHRVKCVRLRGVRSFGLLLPAPEGAKEGDDVAEHFGVEHYEPEMEKCCTHGNAVAAPAELATLSKYDIDALRRYRHVFCEGEPVWVTEKIHGANARYCYLNGEMYCGSRSQWKARDERSIWWRALTPEMQRFCEGTPGVVLYGEVYGGVQDLKYGLGNQVKFAAFDVLGDDGHFWQPSSAEKILEDNGIDMVPFLGIYEFAWEDILEAAEGPSAVPGADHVREGCVVKPIVERWHQAIGRVIAKVVGAGYLEKS